MKPPRLALLAAAALTALARVPALDLNAAKAADQLRWGVLAWHRGLFNDAILSFEKALGYQPADVLAETWLGRALYSSGYVPQALQAWDRLVAAGTATPLLQYQVEQVRFLSGLGRDLPAVPRYIASVGIDGTSRTGRSFRRPTAVRPQEDGSFYVVAFGSNEILRYDANGRLLGVLGGGLPALDRPFDVLEAADGTVLVSEYGANRIARLNRRGDRVGAIGPKLGAPPAGAVPGAARASLLGPQYLAADGRGYLWVTDWGNARAVKFDLDGRFILAVEGLQGPSGIAVHEGRVFVSEKDVHRIAVFDLDGNPITTIGEEVLREPEGLAVAEDGALLVADAGRLRACDVAREIWSERGDVTAVARRIVQAAQGVNGEIFAADFDGSRIVLLSDATSLYTGLGTRVERVNAANFPEVFLEVSVQTRTGRPVRGLSIDNFIVTEGRFSVGRTELVARTSALDVALLVERSIALEPQREAVRRAIEELWQLVTADGRMSAVSAGERAVREAEYGQSRLRYVQAALQAPPAADWRLDAGIRLAADGLVAGDGTARRSLVLLSSGGTGARPWRATSLTELAAYLKANEVAFFPVGFGDGGIDEDLAYLAAETGGESFAASDPGGMAAVVAALRARTTSRYTIRYTSPSDSDFGQRYLPLEVEVTLQKMSGRDEAGYYAPAR